jgi:hypothetical protein
MEIGKDYKEGPYDSKFENKWPESEFPEFKRSSPFSSSLLLYL